MLTLDLLAERRIIEILDRGDSDDLRLESTYFEKVVLKMSQQHTPAVPHSRGTADSQGG